MKYSRMKTLVVLVLSIMLSVTGVAAASVQEQSGKEVGMPIGERVGQPDLNILTGWDIQYDKTEDITINTEMKLRFEWAMESDITQEIQVGDYFEFKLPEELKSKREHHGVFAKGIFVVDTEGNVRITFTEPIDEMGDISGFIEFEGSLNELIIEGPGKITIKSPVSDEESVELIIKPETKFSAIEKSVVHPGDDATDIKWWIDINKSYETLTNPVIKEYLPEGLTLSDLDSIKVYPLYLNLDGSEKTPAHGEAYDASLVRVETDPDTGLITIKLINPDGSDVILEGPLAIEVNTVIDKDKQLFEGGSVSFTNEATLEADDLDETIKSSSSVTVDYAKLLEKTQVKYDPLKQEVEWLVKYNYGNKQLGKTVLEDTYSEGLMLDRTRFTIVDKEGNALEENTHYKINETGNTFEIEFLIDVNEAYDIKYVTKVKDGVLITDDVTFNNTIKTKVDDKEYQSGSDIRFKGQMIDKTASMPNYDEKTISWTIDINKNEYLMKHASLNDRYVNLGLSLKESTLKVIDLSQDGKTLILGEDYTFVKVFDEQGVELGFDLQFIGDYEPTSSRLKITFTTDYDVNDLASYSLGWLENSAQLNWTDQYDENHINKDNDSKLLNQSALNNGAKSGSYNAQSKLITWQVDVNYNLEDLKEASLTDAITKGQVYVENSLRIYTYDVAANGNIHNVQEITDLSIFDIEYPSLDNEQTLKVGLPDGMVRYRIVFDTEIENNEIAKEYSNTAILHNKGFKDRHLSASVEIRYGQSYTSKTGEQDGDIIKWSVKVNQSQSTLADAVLFDESSSNQIFIESSFGLYPVKVHENGTYDVLRDQALVLGVDYTLEFTTLKDHSQTFKLVFADTIDLTYVLEYESLINAEAAPEIKVQNKITMNGNGISYQDGEGSSEILIDVSESDGGIVGTKGSFKIQKLGEDDQPLEGVVFDLYNRKGVKVASHTTDENGYIHFESLVYGKFELKEVMTLPGYVISDILFDGIEIVIDAKSSRDDFVMTLNNHMNRTEISKVDIHKNLVSGSIFDLELLVDGSYELVQENLEVTSGRIEIKGLAVGNYRLIERVSASDYILNTESLFFEVLADGNGQAIDNSVEFTNYQGSVELIKFDMEGNLLEDVEFDLYTEDDQIVSKGLLTDDQGRIEVLDSLAPGNYYFKEVRSVDGNIVNETPLTFTITDRAAGVPELVQLIATNGKGSVTFKKVDANNKPLSGVMFDLYDQSSGDIIGSVVSDSDGVVRVDQLIPGLYYFEEVKSLDGYIINSEKIKFVVPEYTYEATTLIELSDFINYQGSISIDKVDPQGLALDGASFELRDADGILVSNQMSVDGKVVFNNLKPGSYTLKEVGAPTGYMLDEAAYDFVIPETFEGEYIGEFIRVINHEIPVTELPPTGVTSQSLIASLMMIGVGIFLVYTKQRKENY